MEYKIAIVMAAGFATTIIILTALILYDSGKPIEYSPFELKVEFKRSNDVTASRVITLPDKDMDWQGLLGEAYQQGYDHGVKDSINNQPSK